MPCSSASEARQHDQPAQAGAIRANAGALQPGLPEIGRFLGGVAHGLDQLAESEGSICLLGIGIALCDNYTIVEPKCRLQVPSEAMPHLI
ncbi:hypothetical protein [Streptomyces scabiei]|uniref:hypothetical protein n=1 Tax=Streptomyces scabiei TaxID=1930 RepID=UPI000765D1CC|nr:hypothetical protein [Streptomyces scabiei]